jgi:hypothetical protein
MTDGQVSVSAEDAAVPVSSAPNIVRLPNGHIVTLAPKVTLPLGIGAVTALELGGTAAERQAFLAEAYLHLGIVGWDFTEEGKRVPITPENIDRLIPYGDGGLEVAEAASALYSEEVMRPLLARRALLSQPGQSEDSTSLSPDSGPSPREPSALSSPESSGVGKPFAVPVP